MRLLRCICLFILSLLISINSYASQWLYEENHKGVAYHIAKDSQKYFSYLSFVDFEAYNWVGLYVKAIDSSQIVNTINFGNISNEYYSGLGFRMHVEGNARANYFANFGEITMTGQHGDAFEITIYDNGHLNYAVNYGVLNANGLNNSGIEVSVNGHSIVDKVENAGVINVNGYESSGMNFGLGTNDAYIGTIENSGVINVNGGGISHGMYTRLHGTEYIDKIENSGVINVNKGDKGIYVDLWEQSDVGSIVNSGVINVYDGNYGVLVWDYQGTNRQVDVYMPGIINIYGDGYMFGSARMDTNIKSFGMKFQGTQEEFSNIYEGAFREIYGSNFIHFDNTKLYAHIGEDFLQGAEYEIPMLVEGEDEVFDQFASSQVVANPDYRVKLIDGNGSKLQKAKITFEPKASVPQISRQATKQVSSTNKSVVKQDMKAALGGGLSSSFGFDNAALSFNQANAKNTYITGSNFMANDTVPNKIIALDDMTSLFVKTYYTKSNKNTDPVGYDADIYGVIGGLNYQVGDNSIIGFHAGYGYADIQYSGVGYDSREENSDIYTVGVQALTKYNNFLISGISSYNYYDNSYEDGSDIFSSSADYSAHSISSEVELGYMFEIDNYTIVPSVAFHHDYFKSDSFTANDKNGSAGVTYGEFSDNKFSSILGVDLYADYNMGDGWSVTPSIGFGYERVLNPSRLTNEINVGKVSVLYEDEEDKNIYSANAFVSFEKDDHRLSLGYTGEYSTTTKSNTIWLEYGLKF